MSKMEYMPVDCLQVPKMLFQMDKYKNLSNTAKILYSLFLDRLKFAVQNGWVDGEGDLFVIYPKSEMKKDLNTTRYGVDQAVQELVQIGNLVRIIPNNGKANHFYINDIYENEMEEESMMTLDRIMANMPMEEREIIMDKMVKASRDILGTIADMGYLDEYETPLTPMEERGYYDEEGNLDIDAVEADGYEFGMMTNFSRILNEMTSYQADKNQIIQNLVDYPLLIIDDLGIERNSEFALEQVYNVIDSRYCKMLPLIVTTNLGLNEMKSTDLDTAHQRIYSRILEMCVPIYCGGEDKRKEEGTEKLVQVQNLITG